MKKKLTLLLNHTLTPEQLQDAKASLGVEEFVELSQELKALWSGVPPEVDDLSAHLKPIEDFLQANSSKGDFVFVQGEAGATYKMVGFVKKLELTPVYATTKREAVESVVDGKVLKKSLFKHVRFRRY